MLRFWPLWAAYAAIWLLGFAGVWPSLIRYSRLSGLADTVVGSGWLMGILLGCSFGLVAAMCVFSYLHNNKSAYFFHALPVDRTELFGTAMISGLAFVMVPNLIFWLLGTIWCSVFTMATVTESIMMLTMWLLELTSQYIFYFGAAVFCAMLTGHILAMPCLYLAMNFFVPVGEWMLRGLCQQLIWGFEYGSVQLHWLSPLYHEMYEGSMPDVVQDNILRFQVDGYHLLIGAVGIVLIALSWLLYKHRHLENAGDVVAASWLRPLFKYGVGLYGAVPLGILIHLLLFHDFGSYTNSLGVFLCLCFSLLLGGFICYFAAAMLLEKSLKVFKGHIHGYLCLAVILLVVLVGLRVDVLGLETWTPDPEDVVGVRVWGAGNTVNSSDPAVIRAVIDTHKLVLERKEALEEPGWIYDSISYYVADNGGTPTMFLKEKYVVTQASNGNLVIPSIEYAAKEDLIAGNQLATLASDKEIYTRSIVYASNTTLQIRYTMKSGYRVERSYQIPVTSENKTETLRAALANLGDLNLEQQLGIHQKYERVDSMSLQFSMAHDLMDDRNVDSLMDRELVLSAIMADYLAGNFHGTQNVLLEDRAYYENATGWRLEYQLARDLPKGEGSDAVYEDYTYYSVMLPRSAVHTLSTLRSLGVLADSELLVIAD